METQSIKLQTGYGSLKKESHSGSELFNKILLTEFGDFCLNSFVKGCIRNASDLESFKSKYPNQSETIISIFNYLLETEKLTVNDEGYFRLNEFIIDARINESTSEEEGKQKQFLFSEKIKKMSLSAIEAKLNDQNKKPYVGSMVFTISDHPEIEIKKSAVTAEILRLLKQLSDLDAAKIREGYKPKNLTNLAFIGSISNFESDNSEVI